MTARRLAAFYLGLASIGVLGAGIGAVPAIAQTSPEPRPVVKTDRGPVRGVSSPDHRAFLGIPYAAPPTGDLRWRSPRRHASWSKPIDATTVSPPCAQGTAGLANPGSVEDCLEVNVYTPPTGHGRAPVIVWFHGGGFVVGAANSIDGSALAARQHVVVVTVNYRLGVFGFLALPSLTRESDIHSSGDYGIEDQQAALRWIHRNIAAFGGDPANVTISGQSAGGVSVCIHMVSPASKGLFQRAISESGCASYDRTLEQSERMGEQLTANLGCDRKPDVLACLRSSSADELRAALVTDSLDPKTPQWRPTIDGVVLPKAVEESFVHGNVAKVPLLIGSVHDEGTLSVAFQYNFAGSPLNDEQYPDAVSIRFGARAPAVVAQYPASKYPSAGVALAEAIGDSSSCAVHRTSKVIAARVPTYVFEFDDPTAPPIVAVPDFDQKAYHSSELQYVFHSGYGVSVGEQSLMPTQQKLADQMGDYWARFAASGDPNRSGLMRWPRYNAANGRLIRFALPKNDVTTGSSFARDHQCAFWKSNPKPVD